MKTIILYSFLCLVCLTSCQKCKKSATLDKVTISGTIYTDCYNVSKNTIYYRVYPSYFKQTPVEFVTNDNGLFNIEVDKSEANAHFLISVDKNPNNAFVAFYGTGENLNIGSIKETANNTLVLKLKTNHTLTNLDTIRYVFQYGNFEAPIYGPITKDTIIGTYIKSINSAGYNNSPTSGKLKTLWWNFGMTSPTNQTQVDYIIHGCAGVADTAYIVIP